MDWWLDRDRSARTPACAPLSARDTGSGETIHSTPAIARSDARSGAPARPAAALVPLKSLGWSYGGWIAPAGNSKADPEGSTMIARRRAVSIGSQAPSGPAAIGRHTLLQKVLE